MYFSTLHYGTTAAKNNVAKLYAREGRERSEGDNSKEDEREEEREGRKEVGASGGFASTWYLRRHFLTVNNFPRGCERHYASRVSPPRIFGRTSRSSIRHLNRLAIHLPRLAPPFSSLCKLKRRRRARHRPETTAQSPQACQIVISHRGEKHINLKKK